MHGGLELVGIRPFSLRDVPLLVRMQRRGIALPVGQTLRHPRKPLWLALTSPFPWHGTGSATYVLPGKGSRGFVQLRKRSDRPEAEVSFVAPALDGQPETVETWHALLKHSAQDARQYGVQRLYAALPEDQQMLEVLLTAGFRYYTREEIWRLESPRRMQRRVIPAEGNLRLCRKADDWALQRIYAGNTPQPVQQAEGRVSGEEATQLPHSDGEQVFVLERKAEVVAAIRLWTGDSGYWLRFQGDAHDAETMATLLNHALRILADEVERPVYVAAREYQSGLFTALEDSQFRCHTTWNHLVKYNVALEKGVVKKVVPSLEVSTESPLGVVRNGDGRVPDPALSGPALAWPQERH